MVYPYWEADLANVEQAIDELCASPSPLQSTGRIMTASAITKLLGEIHNKIDNAIGRKRSIDDIIRRLGMHVNDLGSTSGYTADLHCELARTALHSLRERLGAVGP